MDYFECPEIMKKHQGFTLIQFLIVLSVVELLVLVVMLFVFGTGSVIVYQNRQQQEPTQKQFTPTTLPTNKIPPTTTQPEEILRSSCQTDADCKLIASHCSCIAVDKTDPRKFLTIPGEPNCITNDCITYDAKPVCQRGRCHVQLRSASDTENMDQYKSAPPDTTPYTRPLLLEEQKVQE